MRKNGTSSKLCLHRTDDELAVADALLDLPRLSRSSWRREGFGPATTDAITNLAGVAEERELSS